MAISTPEIGHIQKDIDHHPIEDANVNIIFQEENNDDYDLCFSSPMQEFILRVVNAVKLQLSSKRLQGSILVLLSAFVFSIMTLFVDLAGEKGIPSFEMMIVRCFGQLIYSAIVCYFIGLNPFGEKGNRTLPVLRGLFGPLATGALYYGATKIDIADATVLKFTSPIWTLIIARIVLKERITIVNCCSIIVGFIGVLFVAQPQFLLDFIIETDPAEVISYSDENLQAPGTLDYAITVCICLFGAVCSSCVYVVIRKSGGSVHFQVLIFYYGLIGIFTSTILLLVFQGPPVTPTDWTGYVDVLIISVCGCIAQTTFNKGAQLIDATKTAVFRSSDVVFVLIWQVTLLHDIPTFWSLIGMCLICSCTIVMAISKQNPKKDLIDDVNTSEPIEMECLVIEGEANTLK